MSDRLIESGRACPGLDHGARLKVSKATDGCRERCSMTDHEMNQMRKHLAEAMGWHNIRMSVSNAYDAEGHQYQSCTMRGAAPGARPESNMHVPDPLESDRDAALLRAWCLEQGWTVKSEHTPAPRTTIDRAWPAVMVRASRAPVVVSALVRHAEEPDYCRRERLALCRAVLRAIETGEAQ